MLLDHPVKVKIKISHGRLKSLVTLDETLGSLGLPQKSHQELRYKPSKLLSDVKKRDSSAPYFEFGPHWAEVTNEEAAPPSPSCPV